ncbi:hypothetical protein AB1Y20_010786 [Prymnesium parvum]|uniref:RNA-binding S4 domain-containing protein n=1 Tax=Prymnesium parvum TaxID=97485 RepID=A0AB34IQH3_PRYPA
MLRLSSRLASAKPPPPAKLPILQLHTARIHSHARVLLRAPPLLPPRSSPTGLLVAPRRSFATPPPDAVPPPPNKPPGPGERIPVFFPRATSHKASLEVKRRIKYLIPHMKGKWLKWLVRKHHRSGTTNSFVSALESRLDLFLWRCNLVPSTWAARHLIGYKKIMVNGQVITTHSRQLKPFDIVEPVPSAIPIIKRLMKSRLKNNTFVYMKSGRSNTTEPSKAQDGQAQARAAKYDLSKLQEDSEATALSYRRLPPPIATESFTHGAAALPRDAHICLHALVPALLGVLAADTPLGDELRSRQHELAVIAPAQGEGEDDAPPLTLTWQRQEGPPVKLLELDRVAVRRVLLGLLALQSGAESARP